MAVYLIIFGAAVRADGSASGSLQRRVEGALANAEAIADAKFIPTGGLGRYAPPEAVVMERLLLQNDVKPENIFLEDKAHDTLESIRYSHAILAACDDVDAVIPCTSPYHIPRCALLLRMLGYKVRIPEMPADRPHLALRKWIVFVLKEFLALPYDALLLLLKH
jgi:uncharacterized SAM-binding protein YcdF (DUF218 family)